MDTSYQLTSAKPEHLDAIHQLATAASLWQTEPAAESRHSGFLVSAFTREDYAKYVHQADQFHVALQNNRLAGFVLAYSRERIESSWHVDWEVCQQHPQKFVLIKQVCIAPDFRRIGLGTKLYRHIWEQCGCALAAAIVLEPPNEASVVFHERLGFRRVLEVTPPDGIPRGVWWREPSEDDSATGSAEEATAGPG